jgi:hypothetical protein
LLLPQAALGLVIDALCAAAAFFLNVFETARQGFGGKNTIKISRNGRAREGYNHRFPIVSNSASCCTLNMERTNEQQQPTWKGYRQTACAIHKQLESRKKWMGKDEWRRRRP